MRKNILTRIIENKKKEIQERKKIFPIDKKCLRPILSKRNFKESIRASNKISLIAEIKKSSPSAGVLRKKFDPVLIAKQYEKSGVSAISILTDKKFFSGNLTHIKLLKEEVNLPILRKDFIIDEYQIYESIYYRADAILLIADILSVEQLKDFIKIASDYKIHCLVESHTEDSIKKSIISGAGIIGINNRNLKNFKINLDTTVELLKCIPQDKIVVSESGIVSNKDIKYLENLGVDAVLVGEAFMKSKDIVRKVKELMEY